MVDMNTATSRDAIRPKGDITKDVWVSPRAAERRAQPRRVPDTHLHAGSAEDFFKASVSTIESLVDMEIRTSKRLREKLMRSFKDNAFQREMTATFLKLY